MKTVSIKKRMPTVIFIIAVFAAFLCNFIPTRIPTLIVRLVIYLSIYVTWGISTKRRIIDSKIRRLFVLISFLMVFWMLLRTVKCFILDDPLEHYLWYLYYIPMIFTPFLVAVIALLVRREDGYRLPKYINIFALIGAVIVILVFTNDFHQLMFVFPDNKPFSSFDYSYGMGYALPFVWRVGCIVAALVILFKRCRLPNRNRRILAPMLPLMLLIVYYAFYSLNIPLLYHLFGDLSAVECLLSICMLELCMKTGFIQSNSQYVELFRKSTINARITDDELNIILSSDSANEISKESLKKAVATPVILDGGLRLSCLPIKNGYVAWCDDVNDVIKTIDELNNVNHILNVKRERVQNEYEIAKKENQTSERKKLYRRVLEKTENEIILYSELSNKIANEEDPDEIKRIACHIAVICAYIKRIISLVFSVDGSGEISAEQLGICICKDSLPCIARCGAECDYLSEYGGKMNFEDVIGIYKKFNCVAMYSLDTLKSLSVKLIEDDGFAALLLEIVCDADLTYLADDMVTVDRSSDKYLLKIGGACREQAAT